MCVFLISPVPIAEQLTSELIGSPVFHNLAPDRLNTGFWYPYLVDGITDYSIMGSIVFRRIRYRHGVQMHVNTEFRSAPRLFYLFI